MNTCLSGLWDALIEKYYGKLYDVSGTKGEIDYKNSLAVAVPAGNVVELQVSAVRSLGNVADW